MEKTSTRLISTAKAFHELKSLMICKIRAGSKLAPPLCSEGFI